MPSDEMKEALDTFYTDNHRWSTRPCETCAAITRATGISFGCDKMAGRMLLATPAPAAPEVDLPYYPMWEEVYKLHQQERILMGEAMERIVAKVQREAMIEVAEMIERGTYSREIVRTIPKAIRALAEKEQS